MWNGWKSLSTSTSRESTTTSTTGSGPSLSYTGFYMSTSKRVLYISYDGMTDQLGQPQVIPYLAALSRRASAITILSVEKKERMTKGETMIRELLAKHGISWEYLLFSKRPPLLSKWYDQQKLTS